MKPTTCLDPLGGVAQVERVVEAGHGVLAHLGNLEHLAELVRVAREQVQEGEALEVLFSSIFGVRL